MEMRRRGVGSFMLCGERGGWEDLLLLFGGLFKGL